jgi:hypothetical protein
MCSFTRQVVVPFYRAKDTTYNIRLTCGLHDKAHGQLTL